MSFWSVLYYKNFLCILYFFKLYIVCKNYFLSSIFSILYIVHCILYYFTYYIVYCTFVCYILYVAHSIFCLKHEEYTICTIFIFNSINRKTYNTTTCKFLNNVSLILIDHSFIRNELYFLSPVYISSREMLFSFFSFKIFISPFLFFSSPPLFFVCLHI